ncbi:MAG: flippase-like domain-containing protein [Planctomycetes bacterium]|nr:flippase-like domain-containing protein [Planctomycetota bacterium]
MKVAVVYNRESRNVINLFGQSNQERIGLATIRRIAGALRKGGHQAKAFEADKDLIPKLEEFYESTRVLLSPRAVLLMTGLSAFSWFFEVLGFYFTLVGLGLSHDGELLLQAAFILPIATLASAILLTPGGLGVAEGGITALSMSLLDLSRSAAAVGTLIIRFATLWFGVIVGLIAFAVLSRRLAAESEQESPGDETLATAESLPDAPP